MVQNRSCSARSHRAPEVRHRRAHEGSVHLWLAPPLQSQSSSWVPLVVLELGSSRHRPEAGLTSSPEELACHCWLPPPLQVQSSTRLPLAVPLLVTSRQPPSTRRVPSGSTV